MAQLLDDLIDVARIMQDKITLSEFTVCLPLTNVPSAKKPPQPDSLHATAKLHVLVVNDYVDVADSLALLLLTHETLTEAILAVFFIRLILGMFRFNRDMQNPIFQFYLQ